MGKRGVKVVRIAEVVEINPGSTIQAADALLVLRPRWGEPGRLVDFVDDELRPMGYRLAGIFIDGRTSASSVIGFREARSTAWGHHLYVDDLSTIPDQRGHGHADALMRWVILEAERLGCEAIHLDSGVGADRAAAHRLYMRHRLSISAHHFSRQL